MIIAQQLYDRRDRYGEIAGNDLHNVFRAVCGEPSPAGATPIDPAQLRRWANFQRASYADHLENGTVGAGYLLDIATFCESFL